MPLGQRIAVARDIAFAFSYEHMLLGWRRRGAQISFFSPLANEAPAADADAIYLPGGYPELHAGRIAASNGFREAMLEAAARGARIYGECGGYMVLGEGLIDAVRRAACDAWAFAGDDQLSEAGAAPRLSARYAPRRLLFHAADDGA